MRSQDPPWYTYQERLDLADRYKRDFLDLTAAANVVQEHPQVESFDFVQGSDLVNCERIPAYREIRHKLRSYREARNPAADNLHFVSHRWLSDDHPDPQGRQLRLLAPVIVAKDYYWIDWSCLPQQARTSEEQIAFQTSMQRLASLMFDIHFVVLRCRDDAYFTRAWCFFEMLSANVLGRTLKSLTESGASSTESIERNTLEATLADRKLPAPLAASVPSDIATLQEMTQTIALFFELRLVEQYMIFGQLLSDEKLFWGEDPYYYVATCDFSSVMAWTFEKARALGLHLIDLTRDAFEHNFFVAMAQQEHFQHTTNPYLFPRKVVLDQARLGWFLVNKHAGASAHNLFYLLTAMIR